LGKETQAQSTEDALRWWEAYQLAEAGEIDELRARVDAGDDHARWHLASLLAESHREPEAANLIRPLADAGDDIAAMWLARWLVDKYHSSVDAAELRERAQAGDYYSIQALADVLAYQGKIAELRELLCPDGEIDELRRRAAAGEPRAQWWLDNLPER